MVFARYTHPPPTTVQLYLAVSQLPVVRSEHVRTLFDSTQSQVSLCNGTRQCALGPIFRHTLYLWCLGSNLDVCVGGGLDRGMDISIIFKM